MTRAAQPATDERALAVRAESQLIAQSERGRGHTVKVERADDGGSVRPHSPSRRNVGDGHDDMRPDPPVPQCPKHLLHRQPPRRSCLCRIVRYHPPGDDLLFPVREVADGEEERPRSARRAGEEADDKEGDAAGHGPLDEHEPLPAVVPRVGSAEREDAVGEETRSGARKTVAEEEDGSDGRELAALVESG